MLRTSLLASVIILGGCSTFVEKSIQDVTIETPGAYNAVCHLYIDGLRYKSRPPQTISIHKTKENMKVDCIAPGNRRRTLYIEPEVSNTSAWNMAVAGVGYPYDYASGAMFKYPSRIVVDFTDAKITDMPLPAQNQPDIRQPEDYDLEEFSPGQPRLNSDRDAITTSILRRNEGAYADDSYVEPTPHGKGQLMDVNPAEGYSALPDSGPVQLIPGE